MISDFTASDIIAFRRKYGMSQRELGEATGLHRGHLASVEQGRRPVSEHVSTPVTSFIAFVEECERDGRL